MSAGFERLGVQAQDTGRVALVIDTGASMAFGRPTKLRHAARIASALASMALRTADPVVALTMANTPRQVMCEQAPQGLQRIVGVLDGLRPGGTTRLDKAAATASAALGRPGLCVVLSDLLDPAGAFAGARAMRLRGHEVAVVEVLAPFIPKLRIGTSRSGALEAYREALAMHREALEAEATDLGVSVLRVRTDEPWELDVSLAGAA